MILLEAVDGGLASLGETAKQAVLFHLEKSFGIRKDDIPRKAAAFARAVEAIFGPGAAFLENLILERLGENMRVHVDWTRDSQFEFNDCVAQARRCFHQKRRNKNAEDGRGGDDVTVQVYLLDTPSGNGQRREVSTRG
jgi:hypothetical protein